jgi:choice-of-anchor C domain-containing protein
VNGSFEAPIVGGSHLLKYAPYTFGGWILESGSLDIVRTIWTAAEGVQSLDLSGAGAGTIYQDLPTVAGKQYTLTFQMAGNFVTNPAVKSMEVFWNGTSLGIFTFDVTGRSATNMGWVTHSLPALVATGATTRLKFVSLTNTAYGPALDDVHVVEGGPGLVSLKLSKTLMAGCLKATGKVTLTEPAPAAGTVVTLSSSNPKVTLPASVTLKEGLVAKAFPITTAVVTDLEAATISASVPGTTLSAVLTVRPIGVKKVTLTPATVIGGAGVAGTVALECPAAPGDIVVALRSTKPGAALPDVSEFVVPQGAGSGEFGVTTFPVIVTTKPSLKATANGITKAKVLVVTPPAP